jgi:hypothetical protein
VVLKQTSFPYWFDLQDRPIRQRVIVEKTNSIEAKKSIRTLKNYRFQQLHEVARALYEEFQISGKRTQDLLNQISQGIARGTNGTHYTPQRNIWLVNLVSTIHMWRFAVMWSHVLDLEKNSFVFGKKFLYFLFNFNCGILDKGP